MFNDILTKLKKKIIDNRKVLYSIIGALWIITTIFTFYVLGLPVEITEEINDNNIIEETTFSFKAEVIPFALYPKGGIIDIDKEVFTKVAKDIIIHIDSSVKSDKPVRVNGTMKVILKLVAEELWDKEYLLGYETAFELEGLDNKIINNDYNIDLGELTAFIDKVEEEINTRPSKYVFEIKPVINGTITHEDGEIPIDQSALVLIDYSDIQMKLSEENKFSKVTPIIKASVIPQKLNILGRDFSLIAAKYILGIIYLISFAALVILAIRNISVFRPELTETQSIDKKYKSRLLNVIQEVNTLDYEKINLDSFNALLKISDEKEALIFRFEGNDRLIYYIVKDGCVYLYQVDNTSVDNINIKNDAIA